MGCGGSLRDVVSKWWGMWWLNGEGCGGSMVARQTVNMQFRVRIWHLSNLQGYVSSLGSQQGWHDNCRLASEERQRQKKIQNTKKIVKSIFVPR